MPLQIRDAAAADAGAINDIYNHYVTHSTSTYQLDPDDLDSRWRWLAGHGSRHPVTVCECDGEILGWASLSPFRPREAFALSVENSVYVRHDRQRRGVGRALMVDLIARARALGYHTIVAGVSADQEPSLIMHRELGFLEVARLREVGRKFDRWLDLTYLQLML